MPNTDRRGSAKARLMTAASISALILSTGIASAWPIRAGDGPADKPILQPGESAAFRTDVRHPSSAIADINVDLALPDDRWRRAEVRR